MFPIIGGNQATIDLSVNPVNYTGSGSSSERSWIIMGSLSGFASSGMVLDATASISGYYLANPGAVYGQGLAIRVRVISTSGTDTTSITRYGDDPTVSFDTWNSPGSSTAFGINMVGSGVHTATFEVDFSDNGGVDVIETLTANITYTKS